MARGLLISLYLPATEVRWKSCNDGGAGKLGYILLWALGVPIPVLFVIFLLRGCT